MSYAIAYKAAAAAAAIGPTGWPAGWTFPVGPTWGPMPPGWTSLTAEDIGGIDSADPTNNVAIGTIENIYSSSDEKRNLIYFGSTAINIALYNYLVLDNPTHTMEWGTEDLSPGGATTGKNSDILVNTITADFDPDTVTWNTKPAVGGTSVGLNPKFFTAFAASGTDTDSDNLEQVVDSFWVDITSLSGSIYGLQLSGYSHNRSDPTNGVPSKPLFGTNTLNTTMTYDSGSLPLLLIAP